MVVRAELAAFLRGLFGALLHHGFRGFLFGVFLLLHALRHNVSPFAVRNFTAAPMNLLWTFHVPV